MEQARQRYAGRGKEGRSRLLNEVCELCGYERKYAIKVLSGRSDCGRKRAKRGGSQTIYGVAEREVIKAIWLAAEQPCGKSLKAALRVWLPHYEKRHGQLESSLRPRCWARARFLNQEIRNPFSRKRNASCVPALKAWPLLPYRSASRQRCRGPFVAA